MRRKPVPMTDLTGGLDLAKDPLYLTDKESPNLSMIRFHKGMLKKMFGRATLATLPASERCMEFYVYKQYDGDEYAICCGVDHAYKFTAGAWALISTDPGPVFTGTALNMFFSTTFKDLYLVTNGKDVIQKWTGAAWASMTGDIIAKFMVPFYSRLVVANTVESGTIYPGRLRWSIINDPETWTGTGSGAIDIVDTQDAISGLAILGDRLFIFKEESIWECYYIGGTDVFKVRKVVDKIGTTAPKTIVNTGGFLVFFGQDDIYVFDGATAIPIGMNLYPYLYETAQKVIDTKSLVMAHALYDYESKNYIVCLPTLDNVNPNLLIFYDLNAKTFSRRTTVCSAMGFYIEKTGQTTWTAAVGAWTAAAWAVPWRTGVLASGMPTLLFGGVDGVVVKENKITKSTELLVWESKDFVLAHGNRFVEFRFLAKGDPFEVSYSYDGGVNWTEPITLTPSEVELQEVINYVNTTTFKVRIRITSIGETFEMLWIEPWYIQRTRSSTILEGAELNISDKLKFTTTVLSFGDEELEMGG